jgi:hypothetical protein
MYGGGMVWEKPTNARDSKISDVNSSFFKIKIIKSKVNRKFIKN